MKKAYWIIAGVAALSAVMFGATSCTGITPDTEELTKFEETRTLMDTFVTITVYTSDEENAEEVISAAFARMEEMIKFARRRERLTTFTGKGLLRCPICQREMELKRFFS